MSNWSIPFDQLAAKAKLDIDRVVKSSTQKLFERVILLSPVDTGRFRGNWFPSPGVILRRVDESAKANDSMGRLAEIYTYPVGSVVFLTNSLPYSLRLEHGWSQQAPSGMVRKSAVEFKRIVRQIIRE